MTNFFSRTNIIAIALLAAMAAAALFASYGDSITTDETPHITAGYSYLKYMDYRINPEHPPLVKDIAAFPLLFLHLNFPDQSPSWTTNINDQWSLGPQFLFQSGNNPDQIIWWGRMGPILVMLLLGVGIFLWTKKLFGEKTALFTLFIYALSPEFIGHGHLVTTDVPAAAAFLFGTWAYLHFLERQTWKNFFLASAVIAIAQATKFSLILLWPLFIVATILWVIFKDPPLEIISFQLIKRLFRYAVVFTGVVAMSYVFLYPIYQFHVINYPPERQIQDINAILNGPQLAPINHVLVWMADKPVLRSYAQYLFGLTMVVLRIGGGNTTYFLGQVANVAWWYYFPVVYLLKIPTAFLILLGFSTLLFIKSLWRNFTILNRAYALEGRIHGCWVMLKEFMQENFTEFAMVLFILLYWTTSMTGNLNIGVRHIIPTFPFIMILVAGQIHRWIHEPITIMPTHPLAAVAQAVTAYTKKWFRVLFIAVLLFWYGATSIAVAPYYLAYFNEIAGGPANGYKYATDSNLDWGQNLRRLAAFVEQNHIDKIKVDYFGGSSPTYYLGDHYEQMNASLGPQKGWLAISTTFLQQGRATPARGWKESTTFYQWLDAYQPVAEIGYSIFVYHIE